MAEFKINELQEVHSYVVAEEKLWLTADREKVVKDGSDEAAYLYVTEGKRIPREEAERYGLVKSKKK